MCEITPAAPACLQQSPAPPQGTLRARATGEAIRASYLMAPARRLPPANRPASPGIHHCQPPRSGPIALTAACRLSRSMLALSEVFFDAVLKHAHLDFKMNTHVCDSRYVAGVSATALSRHALPSRLLHCRGHTVGGSGAMIVTLLVSHSHPPLRRPFRLCDWRLADRPAAAERDAARAERVGSASLACDVSCLCARGSRSCRGCCTRCASSRA